SWGTFDGRQETLQPLLGQLSWLAEQSCSHRRVLALTQSIEAASESRHTLFPARREWVAHTKPARRAPAPDGFSATAAPVPS
ncbi:hypothetical protein ONJ45_28195, partial [Salmonella enterica subsp. enterica serovar Virginia]|nr:hypothetical protein [Salmonella enterica subsp. enterica serovar Virginia]